MSEQETDVRDVLGVAGHPLSSREVALAAGVKLATTRGILRRLLEAGEVTRDPDDRYRANPEVTLGGPGDQEVRTRSAVGEHDGVVRRAVLEHGGERGLTITEVSLLVGLRRRVAENTLWRLERSGDLVSLGRPRRYLPHPAGIGPA